MIEIKKDVLCINTLEPFRFNQYGRNSEENERKTGRTEEESITSRYETTDSASVLNMYFVELN